MKLIIMKLMSTCEHLEGVSAETYLVTVAVENCLCPITMASFSSHVNLSLSVTYITYYRLFHQNKFKVHAVFHVYGVDIFGT